MLLVIKDLRVQPMTRMKSNDYDFHGKCNDIWLMVIHIQRVMGTQQKKHVS